MVVVIGDDPKDAKFFAELQRCLNDTGIALVWWISTYFNNKDKPKSIPPALESYRKRVFLMVKDMEVIFGKNKKVGNKMRKRK